jgi:hypothetical protein
MQSGACEAVLSVPVRGHARTCGRVCMCEVVWRVRRETTLTLSADLLGIECWIMLSGNRAHAMCCYNSLLNRITITKNANRSSTASLQTFKKLHPDSVYSVAQW